jgi:uncharacterized protein YecE (DUF72 family)
VDRAGGSRAAPAGSGPLSPTQPSPARIRVGCSGWSYAGWRHNVYAGVPARRWFETYATWFDTVELNTTFYRLPRPETVEAWAAAAPPGFEYAVKLAGFVTHRRKLLDPERSWDLHADRARRLGRTLGVTLVQLPPRWRLDLARLEAFLDAAPADLRLALEIREPTWFDDRVYDLLARRDVALCLHDMIPDHPVIVTATHAYLRCHGPKAPERPYVGRYPPRRREQLVELVDWLAQRCATVRCYFNNDTAGAAVADARWLDRRVRALAA